MNTLKEAVKLLEEVEMTLLRAEVRVATLNGELADKLDPMSSEDVLGIQMKLECVHAQVTKLENVLLKKINMTLRKRLFELLKLEEGKQEYHGHEDVASRSLE